MTQNISICIVTSSVDLKFAYDPEFCVLYMHYGAQQFMNQISTQFMYFSNSCSSANGALATMNFFVKLSIGMAMIFIESSSSILYNLVSSIIIGSANNSILKFNCVLLAMRYYAPTIYANLQHSFVGKGVVKIYFCLSISILCNF